MSLSNALHCDYNMASGHSFDPFSFLLDRVAITLKGPCLVICTVTITINIWPKATPYIDLVSCVAGWLQHDTRLASRGYLDWQVSPQAIPYIDLVSCVTGWLQYDTRSAPRSCLDWQVSSRCSDLRVYIRNNHQGLKALQGTRLPEESAWMCGKGRQGLWNSMIYKLFV